MQHLRKWDQDCLSERGSGVGNVVSRSTNSRFNLTPVSSSRRTSFSSNKSYPHPPSSEQLSMILRSTGALLRVILRRGVEGNDVTLFRCNIVNTDCEVCFMDTCSTLVTQTWSKTYRRRCSRLGSLGNEADSSVSCLPLGIHSSLLTNR